MNWTGLEVFDNSISRTNTWLKEFMQELNWTDRRQAYHSFAQVLHAVRDHLTVDAAVRFGAQMPVLLRGVYFDGWNPSTTPVAWTASIDESVVRAVFRLLSRKADEGEIESVEEILPDDLQQLWPDTLRAA